jgi:hypothetical protein
VAKNEVQKVTTGAVEAVGSFAEIAESVLLKGDAEQMMVEQMLRLLNAGTADDIFADQSSSALSLHNDIKDGAVFTIESVSTLPSDIEGAALPWYVILHTDIGVITSGAQGVVLSCLIAHAKGVLPTKVRKASKDLGEGKNLEYLVKV